MSRADYCASGAAPLPRRPLWPLLGPLLCVLIGAEDVFYTYNSREPPDLTFASWINRTQTPSPECRPDCAAFFLNHSNYMEGEVLLFKTKRSRYRAIPVMGPKQHSKFNDALTFKQWLRRVYSDEKAVKVSVRSTDVVRPVILQLHATRDRFRAPVIIHADVFAAADADALQKPVDAAVFVDTARRLLPDAIISLGWTESRQPLSINRLDWKQTFRLVELIYGLKQPVILNMKLSHAVHSAKQLEWLLGADRPAVYLVVKGQVADFVDQFEPIQTLTLLAQGRKLLFDVDDTWRSRIGQMPPTKKGKRNVEEMLWTNMVFPNPFSILSTSVMSGDGIAFLGWPNSLAISNKRPRDYPSVQSVSGKILFMEKRHAREISPSKKSGMIIDFFDSEPSRITSPQLPRSVRAFIGFDGRVSIENREHRKTKRAEAFHESAAGQLPRLPCYGFEVRDKGWRVEMEVWSAHCDDGATSTAEGEYRTFIQLETPPPRQRRSRNVAVGKSGDGAIDFLVQELVHSATTRPPIGLGIILFAVLAHVLSCII